MGSELESPEELADITDHVVRLPTICDTEILLYKDDSIERLELAINSGVRNFLIYLAPSGEEKSIPKKPYALRENINSLKIDPGKISKLINTNRGKLIVVTEDPETALQIAKIKEILNVPVSPEIPIDCITSKFTLTDIPTDISLQEVANDLTKEGLIIEQIKRFNKKGTRTPSETVLITIYGHYLPDEIKVCCNNVKIRMFIDSPRQCTNCFKYNHPSSKCNKETPICRKCSENHKEADCTSSSTFCTNCKQEHLADNLKCPSRVEESKLLKFKNTNHLTFSEARRKWNLKKKEETFAKIVQSNSNPQKEKIDISTASAIPEIRKELASIKSELKKQVDDKFEECLDAMKKAFQQQLVEFSNNLTSRYDQTIVTLQEENNIFKEHIKELQEGYLALDDERVKNVQAILNLLQENKQAILTLQQENNTLKNHIKEIQEGFLAFEEEKVRKNRDIKDPIVANKVDVLKKNLDETQAKFKRDYKKSKSDTCIEPMVTAGTSSPCKEKVESNFQKSVPERVKEYRRKK